MANIEPIMPASELVPNRPVTHATRSNVKKTPKACSTGSCIRLKLSGPKVKFMTIQRAQKMPVSATSTLVK
jgi:hypothetical protein